MTIDAFESIFQGLHSIREKYTTAEKNENVKPETEQGDAFLHQRLMQNTRKRDKQAALEENYSNKKSRKKKLLKSRKLVCKKAKPFRKT